MSEWQLEETAPLDTDVLVYSEFEDDIIVGRKTVYPQITSWSVANSCGFNEDGVIRRVTHWMLLPEKPVAKLKELEGK